MECDHSVEWKQLADSGMTHLVGSLLNYLLVVYLCMYLLMHICMYVSGCLRTSSYSSDGRVEQILIVVLYQNKLIFGNFNMHSTLIVDDLIVIFNTMMIRMKEALAA